MRMTKLAKVSHNMDSFKKFPHSEHYEVLKKILEERMSGNYQAHLLTDLPKESDLLDLQKASLRVIEALEKGETIALYGDYDTDGVTSLACLGRFLRDTLKGADNIRFYQPNRFIEGYGLHEGLVEEMHRDGANLVVTVDCGISDVESAKKVKELGMDLIVTDHHSDGKIDMPVAYAVVNPKRRDQGDIGDLHNLAGVGVAYYLCRQIAIDKEMCPNEATKDLLEFVAVGTIGDLVSLCPMNMILVRHGIESFRDGVNNPGLRGLLKDKELPLVSSEDISFFLAPIFNAKGRMGDPALARECLLEKSPKKALAIAKELIEINEERKRTQKITAEKAIKKVLKNELFKNPIIIVEDKDFHQGVMGIVASKITGLFKRPCIILSEVDKGQYKGSARSYGGLDLYACLKEHEELFNSFGGHKEAAGLSISSKNLAKLKKALSKLADPEMKEKLFDIEIGCLSDLNTSLAFDVLRLGPYGMKNSTPIFKIKGRIREVTVMKDLHLKLFIELNGRMKDIILFNYYPLGAETPHEIFSTHPRADLLGRDVEIRVQAGINQFRGVISGQFLARDIKINEVEDLIPF